MAGEKYEAQHFSGLKVFKGTSYGPAENLPARSKRFRQMTKEEMDRYDKKVKQSKGFDVDGCTGTLSGRIVPVSSDSFQWKCSTWVAEYAACEHSVKNLPKGQELDFLSLVKANIQGVQGYNYYVTFTAKDKADGEIKTYRAKVWYETPQLKLHLKYFKEFKPSKKAVTSRKALGSKSSNGNRRSKAKKITVVAAGGAVLAGFTALLQEMKSQSSSLAHSKARDAASKKWKSMSNAEKQSFISKASLKPKT